MSTPGRNALRTRRGRLAQIPVLELNRRNFDACWPYVLIAVKNASMIAIDLVSAGRPCRMQRTTWDGNHFPFAHNSQRFMISQQGVVRFAGNDDEPIVQLNANMSTHISPLSEFHFPIPALFRELNLQYP